MKERFIVKKFTGFFRSTLCDWLVYELYGLTEEEIRIVEESVSK